MPTKPVFQKIAALAALGCLSAPALANDSSITFIGGVPRLQQENQVAMQAEKLVFSFVPSAATPKAPRAPYCSDGWYADGAVCRSEPHWQADLLYTFVNRGPARTLTIGLPFEMPPCGYEGDVIGPTSCDKTGVSHLTTDIDGVPAKVLRQDVKVGKPVAFNRLYSVQVPFAAGQTRILRHRYQSFTIASVEGNRFRYLLRTGSTWAGPIGKVEIAFELPTGNGPCAAANLPYRYDGRWLKISLGNWTPDRDLNVVFAARPRALMGSGVFADGETLADVCEDGLKLAAPERHLLANQIELLYGAPLAGREAAAKLGPLPFCGSSMYFSGLAEEKGEPPIPVNQIRFMAEKTFPANLPPLLKQCVALLKK